MVDRSVRGRGHFLPGAGPATALCGKPWHLAAACRLQQCIAVAAGIVAALPANGWGTCHGRADSVRVGRHAKAHGLLKARGRVHVAAVSAAVLGFHGVVDAPTGFLAALGDGELPGGLADGLGRSLLQTTLIDGGGAAGQQQGSGQGGEWATIHGKLQCF